MPEGFAGAGVESKKIAMDITREGESAGRSHDSRTWRSASQIMRPPDLACLVIDCFDHALAPQTIIGPGPAVSAVGGLGEIDRVTGVGGDNEQSGLWIETGSSIVGHSTLVRRYQTPIGRRFLGRIGNGTSLLIDPKGPVDWAKGNGEQALTVGSIEHEKIAVAGTL